MYNSSINPKEKDMNWSDPTESEHDAVVRHIKSIRTEDIISCAIFTLIGALFLTFGIYAVIDKFQYAVGLFIVAGILFLISIGCGISNIKKAKRIQNREYKVSRCRVVERKCYRSRYSTDRRVTVFKDNGRNSTYKVNTRNYRKATEGANAIIIEYDRTNPEERDFPQELVVLDSYDE